MSNLPQISIEEENQQVIIEEQMQMEQNNSQFSEDFQSDQEHPQIQTHGINEGRQIPKVPNPISAYSIFMREYRQKNPQEKKSMSVLGEIWKQLTPLEKQSYQKKFKEEKHKYDEYVSLMMSVDPNFKKRNKDQSKSSLFPLHRIKAIMKQDSFYTTSAENVSAMAKATQYFGQYLLEEVKKSTEGKKRIQLSDLFEAINNNQNNLWFLNCLIDEYNINKQGSKPIEKKSEPLKDTTTSGQKKVQKKPAPKSNKTGQVLKGQMKLTDMF